MKLLLDTQCWLWLHAEPDRFAPAILESLGDTRNRLFLSAASAWEIAIKHALGKLPLPMPPGEYVPSRMRRGDTDALPVTHDHALRVAGLPAHHRDPFDRLLVAQCQADGMRLVTGDRQFEPYDVEVIWAR